MRLGVILSLVILSASPISAEERGTPLLRVYIDTPYFYDILFEPLLAFDPAGTTIRLYVEGKEVGESEIALDCGSKDYTETVLRDWSGGSAEFIPAALMSYRNLLCAR